VECRLTDIERDRGDLLVAEGSEVELWCSHDAPPGVVTGSSLTGLL
jgi:hypothetical protein